MPNKTTARSQEKNKGAAALQAAIARRSPKAIQTLLERGCDPNGAAPGTGEPLLLYALTINALDEASELVRAGADPHGSFDGGSYLAWLIIKEGAPRERAIAWLLDRGVDPNRLDAECHVVRHAPLHHAARQGARGVGVVRILLGSGACPRGGEATCLSPLHIAMSHGNFCEEACSLLVAANAPDLDRRDYRGRTARDLAEWAGNARGVQMIEACQRAQAERQALGEAVAPGPSQSRLGGGVRI